MSIIILYAWLLVLNSFILVRYIIYNNAYDKNKKFQQYMYVGRYHIGTHKWNYRKELEILPLPPSIILPK